MRGTFSYSYENRFRSGYITSQLQLIKSQILFIGSINEIAFTRHESAEKNLEEKKEEDIQCSSGATLTFSWKDSMSR